MALQLSVAGSISGKRSIADLDRSAVYRLKRRRWRLSQLPEASCQPRLARRRDGLTCGLWSVVEERRVGPIAVAWL